MNMQELQAVTYRAWENRSRYHCAIVQPEYFESEISTYGDLEDRETWEKAYSVFQALNIEESCLDAYELITIQFNYPSDHAQFELRCRVFDEFLALPDGLELIKAGLEDLFGNGCTPEEQTDGFFAMVERQLRIRADRGDAVGPLKQLIEQAA
ncbi:MAG: hypothetical protein AAGD25_15145 [Cyanobacteria bacterium P01_F01_bin.150]